jgi:hypothetical protein
MTSPKDVREAVSAEELSEITAGLETLAFLAEQSKHRFEMPGCSGNFATKLKGLVAHKDTLLSALSRGDGTTSHDRTTVEYAVREAVVEAANLGREGYDIPKAEAIVTEALRVIWNIAAAPPVPEGEE